MRGEIPVRDLDKDIEAVNTFVYSILKKNDISFTKLIDLVKRKREEEVVLKVPSSIFRERKLGILEALTKYLKEEIKMSYHDMATHLNRDDRVIWTTYNNGKKKFQGRLDIDRQSVWIPASIFANRKIGVLEVLTKYLKEEIELANCEIAGILNRDNRTIWMSYNRAKKKLNE
ncbi:MAG: hypothetical protein ABIC04_01435 [Nanoarchaeota archaeon]